MKRCMIHHPHADMILEGLHIGDDGYPAKPVDNSSSSNGKPKKNNNNSKKKITKEQRASNKQQLITWVESLDTSHIVLTQDVNDM